MKENAKVGTPICDLYKNTKNFIKNKDAGLADVVGPNFGFGNGASFKEEELLIHPSN